MKYFLAKTEPGTYSLADLEKEGETLWEGVSNPLAKKYLKMMKKGDRVLIYHSGKQKAIVGLAQVLDEGEIPKFGFLEKFPEPWVSLSEIKSNHKFSNWSLVRQSRLSTMDVPDAFIEYLKQKRVLR